MVTEVSATNKGIGGWLIVWLIIFFMATLGTFVGSYEHTGIMRILLGLTLCLNTVVLVLFFLQKLLFRKLVILAMIWIWLVLFLDQNVKIDPFTIIGEIIGVSAWVFYFLKSKRVRNTFVR
jgi:hypothetical protein